MSLPVSGFPGRMPRPALSEREEKRRERSALFEKNCIDLTSDGEDGDEEVGGRIVWDTWTGPGEPSLVV
ncbi:uncharacterized protein KY384_005094 [Bacidia gigantensis]|uniref:uncharacterized protein n=1 Tax=Bacidia gigantensis TaxID=2732470 RepID=UPI001D045283|nr:uncharacterized protein KY384_005094 [Bacidia gigantensis]KAG8530591.1 hypothetical protein KY384_005094 [Bacidia gigantensis]